MCGSEPEQVPTSLYFERRSDGFMRLIQPISAGRTPNLSGLVLPLMCGFVLFHDVSLDTATGVDLEALVGRPQPDFAGIGGTGTGPPGPAAGLPGCFGKTAEYFTQFACMSIIEIDCIFDAVKGKRNCLTCLGSVEVIFQKGYYSSCHKESIGLRTLVAWPIFCIRSSGGNPVV